MSILFHKKQDKMKIIEPKTKQELILQMGKIIDGKFSKQIPNIKPLSIFLDYEISSSWWASWIGWNWGQELAGKYFAWKVKRKYARYKQRKAVEELITILNR